MNPTPDVFSRTEVILPGPAEALAGLLDVDLPDLERDGIPLLWHWIYLLDRPDRSDLGSDGHPVRNVVVAPPGPGKRRMWAGGRVRHLGPLIIGQEATRSSEVISRTDKDGRTGPLTFVVVLHTVTQGGRTVVVEEQDIVYRDDVTAAPPTPVIPERLPVGDHQWEIPIDSVLLFRYSALTYNGHRIHYDRDYARNVEGYGGLVTHGPLQALTMAEGARRHGATGPLSIDYRLVSPLMDYEGLIVSVGDSPDEWATTVTDVAGRATARGIVRPIET